MIRCISCDETEIRITSAGSNWLCECTDCHAWWHISDDELKAS